MRTILTVCICGIIIFALLWVGSGPRISPEMHECLRSHGSQEQYAAVLRKYCSPEMIGQAMGLLVVKDPQVVRIKHSGKTVCYLVEGSIADASAQPGGEAIQDYRVCWENGRVVALDFSGGRLMAF
ncbi:MAG: hypothetical protein MUC57_09975 [Desulfobacterales bacterium]|nr:hypothetical protein [Desulfobacterales bacterium]